MSSRSRMEGFHGLHRAVTRIAAAEAGGTRVIFPGLNLQASAVSSVANMAAALDGPAFFPGAGTEIRIVIKDGLSAAQLQNIHTLCSAGLI